MTLSVTAIGGNVALRSGTADRIEHVQRAFFGKLAEVRRRHACHPAELYSAKMNDVAPDVVMRRSAPGDSRGAAAKNRFRNHPITVDNRMITEGWGGRSR